MEKTAFQMALAFALQEGNRSGAFREAMKPLGGGFTITDIGDGRALATAIVTEAAKEPKLGLIAPFSQLTDLMRRAGSPEVFEILQSRALPSLEELFDRYVASDSAKHRDLAGLLAHFVAYQRKEGFDRIVRAIKLNFECGWLWTMVFRALSPEHPLLHEYLGIDLATFPQGFVRVAFLDRASQLALDGLEMRHPFDSEEGRAQLRSWLLDSDPSHFSYAQSAAATLAFLSANGRAELFGLAMDHASPRVQLEGAWSAARVGNEGGISFLARACTDPASYTTASRYLTELNRADAIPAACANPRFIAEAAARWWLAHGNEFGRQPDDLVHFDTRTIQWPPTNDRRTVSLFKYQYVSNDSSKPDQRGVVMVGGRTTFSLFSESTVDMNAEEVYALHCCWELQMAKDPRAPKNRSISEGLRLLKIQRED